MGCRVVVLGAGFAGLTAAVSLRERLGTEHTITVISKNDAFVFLPALVWMALGLRERSDLSFPISKPLEEKGIAFVHASVDEIDLKRHLIQTPSGKHAFDYLVIATGPKLDTRAVPGLGPYDGHSQSIIGVRDAERARFAFEELLQDPGPVVIGAVQGASCFTPAYELILNMAHQLQKRRLRERTPLTFITPEPYLGHFGVGGFRRVSKTTEDIFRKLHIEWVANASVREIREREVLLFGGRRFHFRYSMFIPPFVGIDAVRACIDIVDERGFVKVNDFYRTEAHPEVFAAGVCVSVPAPGPTPVPCGVMKTGHACEEMGRVAAANIAALIHREKLTELPPVKMEAKFVLDAGNGDAASDRLFESRGHTWLLPGPEAHWAKLAMEKYLLAFRRRTHA